MAKKTSGTSSGGRPPNAGQIKKGQRLNPNGRAGKQKEVPHFPTSFDQMFLSNMGREIMAGGAPIAIQERLIQQSIAAALNGNEKVSALLQENCRTIQLDNQARMERDFFPLVERKIALQRDVDRRQRCSEPALDVVPHPAHVAVHGGTLVQVGPKDEVGRRLWACLKYLVRSFRDVARILKGAIASATCESHLVMLRGSLSIAETKLRHFRRAVPKGWNVWESIHSVDETEADIQAWMHTPEFKVYFGG